MKKEFALILMLFATAFIYACTEVVDNANVQSQKVGFSFTVASDPSGRVAEDLPSGTSLLISLVDNMDSPVHARIINFL